MSAPHPADIAAESVRIRHRVKASTPPGGERAKPRVKALAEAPAERKTTAAKKATTAKKSAAKKPGK